MGVLADWRGGPLFQDSPEIAESCLCADPSGLRRVGGGLALPLWGLNV